MNETTNKSVADDDVRFDRLVDGELSADEYRTLLASLDDEPGGWRRCALAFLEAQAMRRELAGIASANPRHVEPAKRVAELASKQRKVDWRLVLGMAASFIAALALGIMLPELWRNGGARPIGNTGALVQNDQQPKTPPTTTLMPREVGSARLMVDGPGGVATSAGEVPIFDMPGDTQSYLQAAGSAVPVNLISDLKRRGHQVEHDQQYVPVDLEDGRRAVIPVESIQITPVSRRAY
jgi:hypothetical protein